MLKLFKSASKVRHRGFTPLEKATEKYEEADAGIRPPSAYTVRERSSLTGFTLLEALAVVMLVALLFSLTGSYLTRMLIQANETDCLSSLAKLSAALEVYRTLYKTYPSDLTYLNSVNPTLSAGQLLSSGSKRGYNYTMDAGALSRNTYALIAEPKVQNLTGSHRFKIDESGNMYRADNMPTVVWSSIDPGTGTGGMTGSSGAAN